MLGARLARITELKAEQFDGLVIPGGFMLQRIYQHLPLKVPRVK